MARPDVRRDVEIGVSLGRAPSEFDRLPEQDRRLLRVEYLARNGVCSAHGGSLDECDVEIWFPRRRVCRPAMEQAAAEWLYGETHEDLPFHDGSFQRWTKHRTRAFPYHYLDGVTITVELEKDPSEDIFKEVRPWED
jgi:hypothetical protein